MTIPVHQRPEQVTSFDRLDMLWQRYPQYHAVSVFSTLDALLEEHESFRKDFDEALRTEYTENGYERFLVQLSWQDLPYRYAAKQAIEKHGPFADNPYVEAFLEQFRHIDPDQKACFLFPESYVSQFFVILEVCLRAEMFKPVRNLFPDEDQIHYLAVFDKEQMDDVLLMYHLLYTNTSEDLFGGYKLYDYSLPWYQNHLLSDDTVLRSPYLPDALAVYQGSLPYYHNPAKTVYVRRNIGHILEAGYFESELDFFYQLTVKIMPFFQWWFKDISLYEEKDGFRTDWRLERTRIRTELTAGHIIKPKWKHELSLFHAVHKRYPDTLYQYRPDWLGRQSLDMYIPSLKTGIEYQGIQHYMPVNFFGGKEALSLRKELDETKRKLCEENEVRLIEWPYSLEPTDANIRSVLAGDDPLMVNRKEDQTAVFLRLKDFDEYMEQFESFCGMERDTVVFRKEDQLMESDEKRTHREKEKTRDRRKREVIAKLQEEIAVLVKETETEGNRILPIRGRKSVVIRYRYPDGKRGDIIHYLAGMNYEPRQTGENEYTVRIRRKDDRLIEMIVMHSRYLFSDYDFEREEEAVGYLTEYNRIARIEYLMAKVNYYREVYRSLRSIEDPALRKLLNRYHKDLRKKTDEIYEYLIGEGLTNPKWKSEQKAYAIILKQYPDAKFQYQPDFLFGQRIDIFIPSMNTAVEYQGKQHYEPVDFFGGAEGQKNNAERDRRKYRRCKANGIQVLYWDYDKPLSEEYFLKELDPLIRKADPLPEPNVKDE